MVTSLAVLPSSQWLPRAIAHETRADAATAGHRARAGRGIKHPVEDFVYEYYGVRPSLLRRWHPGPGIGLEDAEQYRGWRYYATSGGVSALDTREWWAARGSTAEYIETLLRATSSRPAMKGCFGLHEWAMAYRVGEQLRHPLPLRLGQEGTDAVVDAHQLVCTHIDAFRFFTPAAAPRNALQLTRADQVEREQPGCLHATMDLFKWASKLTPAVPSDLVMDAFELAMEVRYVDMQGSPYDVTVMGLTPIQVETPEGKREYAERQAEFTGRGAALRERLLTAIASARDSS